MGFGGVNRVLGFKGFIGFRAYGFWFRRAGCGPSENLGYYSYKIVGFGVLTKSCCCSRE